MLLAALLLSPHIPLMFMGEEFGETRPFLFFTDFHGDLARAVREGRAKEFADHASHQEEGVPDPNALETFTRSKLDWDKVNQPEGESWLSFTRHLLQLRQQVIVPLLATARNGGGKVLDLAPGCVAVTWTFPRGTLSLAFNVGGHTEALPDLPGETLFAWPEIHTELRPDTLIVRFAPGEPT